MQLWTQPVKAEPVFEGVESGYIICSSPTASAPSRDASPGPDSGPVIIPDLTLWLLYPLLPTHPQMSPST